VSHLQDREVEANVNYNLIFLENLLFSKSDYKSWVDLIITKDQKNNTQNENLYFRHLFTSCPGISNGEARFEKHWH